MKTRMRVAATALIAAGVLAGCSQTTSGTVAQTTEPGPPLTTTTSPDDTPTAMPGIPGLPDMSEIPGMPQIPGMPDFGLPEMDVPDVPAPPNAATMSCSEYSGLDDATKRAVIRAILEEPGRKAVTDPWTGQLMADAFCQIIPAAPVRDGLIAPVPEVPGR